METTEVVNASIEETDKEAVIEEIEKESIIKERDKEAVIEETDKELVIEEIDKKAKLEEADKEVKIEETDKKAIIAYVQLPEKIINSCAAKLEDDELHSGVAEVLLEDTNYALRDVATSAIQFMRHGRRHKLLASDFKKAFSITSPDLIYSDGFYDFASNIIDLKIFAEEIEEFKEKEPPVYYHGKWLNMCGSKETTISLDLRNYFDLIVKAILDNDDEISSFAISDLKNNPNILPLVPYFMHFLTTGIRKMGDDILLLPKFMKVTNSLLKNPALYLFHESFLDNLLTSVLSCITRPLATSLGFNNHFVIQDMTACFLSNILKQDIGKSKNKLYFKVISKLESILRDINEPFYSHYGAIVALISLGIYSIAKTLPAYFLSYCKHLSNGLASSEKHVRHDAYMVHGQLLLACKLLIRHCLANDYKLPACVTEVSDPLAKTVYIKESVELKEGGDIVLPYSLFMAFIEYFGDSLAACLTVIQVKNTSKSSLRLFNNNIFLVNEMEHVKQIQEHTFEKEKINNNAKTSYATKSQISTDTDPQESLGVVQVSATKVKIIKKKRSDKVSSFRGNPVVRRKPYIVLNYGTARPPECLKQKQLSTVPVLKTYFNKKFQIIGKKRNCASTNRKTAYLEHFGNLQIIL
ncbi:TAF6-like RNA polymerase II p300/CBP-associated factor-associated factor 65 kDa subunit 6L isoform X2 [Stegodyphus dumicola]|nr:TAF6-like RNA polymerase II p300/CBP-associated factor-associated factor 65 kDa subunit 6L isoform X2 [Stegodyphus dumicola]XP_035211702.1 TAF6-like RNA polymerase II p300/CBP-associated factor-associated factor 65 kDa subunit 6L isoform X2 [Stegodyphus dumicola]